MPAAIVRRLSTDTSAPTHCCGVVDAGTPCRSSSLGSARPAVSCVSRSKSSTAGVTWFGQLQPTVRRWHSWCALLVLRLLGRDHQLIEEELVLTVLVDVLHVVVGAVPHLGGLTIGPIDYPMLHCFSSPFLGRYYRASEDELVFTELVVCALILAAWLPS